MGTTFILFNKAIESLMTGGLNLSDTFRVAIATSSWTPDTDTSTVASLSSAWCGSASGDSPDRKCGSPGAGGSLSDQFTYTADGVIKFDLSDVAITATSGQEMDFRYGHLFASGATVPLGYWEISITSIAAAQYTVQWPAAGIFETSR